MMKAAGGQVELDCKHAEFKKVQNPSSLALSFSIFFVHSSSVIYLDLLWEHRIADCFLH